MARPRTPKSKAVATGRTIENPKRFEGRNEPLVTEGLGDAPEWLIDKEDYRPREAWNTLSKDIPWLNSSHRMLVATASSILGRLIGGQECGVQALGLLKQCLSVMGATPSDASKVGAKQGNDSEDPADQYFT